MAGGAGHGRGCADEQLHGALAGCVREAVQQRAGAAGLQRLHSLHPWGVRGVGYECTAVASQHRGSLHFQTLPTKHSTGLGDADARSSKGGRGLSPPAAPCAASHAARPSAARGSCSPRDFGIHADLPRLQTTTTTIIGSGLPRPTCPAEEAQVGQAVRTVVELLRDHVIPLR